MSDSTRAVPERHSVRGALLFVLSLFVFAGMDTTVKFLTQSMPVPVIAAARFLVQTFLILVIMTPFTGRAIFQTTRTRWVVLRGLSMVVSSLFMGLALKRMPVAETTALMFVAPMVVMLLAGRLLKERVGLWGWASAALGFTGVLCIARPGSGLDAWGLVFALAGVAASACYQLLSRVLGRTERTISMLFYSGLVGILLFGSLLPWTLHGLEPTGAEWWMLLGIGVAGSLAHYLYTSAYAQTPASVLAPLSYLQLLWAALLGWTVFEHVPDVGAMLGMFLIALAGISSAWRVRRA